MSFRRTDAGLTNYSLFLKCDYVVFVEGGRSSLSFNEVMNGSFHSVSIDIHYWKKLFEQFSIEKQCEFRAIGSKSTIKSIARAIVDRSISNVVVAMDRDLDIHTGEVIEGSPLILYTFGYSWENDTWNEKSVVALFASLYPATSLPEESIVYVNEAFKKFQKDSRRIVQADIILAQNGQTLIPRNSGDELIAMNEGIPAFDRSRALVLLKQKNQTKRQKYKSNGCSSAITLRDCYGKLVASFGYKLLKALLKKYGQMNSMPKDVVSVLVINSLSTDEWNNLTKRHYESQMDRLRNTLQ